jgi:hypothetical protein
MNNIHPEIKEACQEVLQKAYNIGRFTKREFGWLDQVIQWFDQPNEQVEFSFSISISNEGESTHYNIEFDTVTLSIDSIQTTYDPEVGTDHFTSYAYSKSKDGINEQGEIFNWQSNAMDALNYFEDNDINVTISIRLEEY